MLTQTVLLIVLVADKAQGDAVLSGILPGNPDESFTSELSADGSTPATHLVCQFSASDAMLAQVEQAEQLPPSGGGVVWKRYAWKLRVPKTLSKTNSTTATLGTA